MGESNATLDRIISTIGELPASPAIVNSVMSLTLDLNSTISDVSRVLSADQSLAAKVLRLSNSSFYGRAKEVGTLAEAVIILGFFTVRSLVIASSAHSMFIRSSALSRATTARLWQHSLSTGLAARRVAERIDPREAEEAFIAGLLHDIGKLVLVQKLGEAYSSIIARAEQTSVPLRTLERERLGFDHCEVGRALVNRWAFPARLTAAIASHHELTPPEPNAVDASVQLGNYLSKELGLGFTPEPPTPAESNPVARALSLGADELTTLGESVREQFQTEARLFDDV